MGWFNSVLDKLKNDFHVPIAVLIFAVVTTIHVWTKRDLGPQYVNSIWATYAFLGGHAGMNAWKEVKTKSDDSDTPQTPST